MTIEELDPIKDLTSAVKALRDSVDNLNRRTRRQGWTIGIMVVSLVADICLTLGFLYVYTEQRSQRQEVLCPLYTVLKDSYNQAIRDTLPDSQRQKYDEAFVVIRKGYDTLGCS